MASSQPSGADFGSYYWTYAATDPTTFYNNFTVNSSQSSYYFLLSGAGGDGGSSAGGGSGGVLYGQISLIFFETNIYFNIPSSGGGNQSITFIQSAGITPVPSPSSLTNTPYVWAGDNGNGTMPGAGGYGQWNIDPPQFSGQSISVINLVQGNAGTSSAGGSSPILFDPTGPYTSLNGAFGIGGNPGGYGSNGLFIIDVNPISFTLTPSTQNVPCFPKGTTIMTPEGYKTVETLEQGSLVTTAANKVVAIKNVYTTTIKTTNANTAPYLIPKHSFGASPTADLRLSPLHAFQVKKGLWQIPKYAALSNKTITQYGLGESVTYYHVECPNFFTDNLIVDGTVVESFAANQAKGLKTLYKYNPALKGFTRAAQPSLLTNKTA